MTKLRKRFAAGAMSLLALGSVFAFDAATNPAEAIIFLDADGNVSGAAIILDAEGNVIGA